MGAESVDDDLKAHVEALAARAKTASRLLRMCNTATKNAALAALAEGLERQRAAIQAANAEDVAAAKAAGLAPALVDRLTLDDRRFADMVAGVRYVAMLPDPVREVLWKRKRPSGITIRKVREPFGVVAVVFESRPNVFVDTAALCLKAGNAVVLRGGREAFATNAALARAVRAALEGVGLAETVQFVDRTEHAAVTALVRATGLVDVAIPRGGERLIRAMCEAALVPVLKHYKGVCHLYVDVTADLAMALRILDNAKTQRPSACNAVECLLIHERIAPTFLPQVRAWAAAKGVTLHEQPSETARGNEYLAFELDVATVPNLGAAVDWINRYGSHHSDAIVTADVAHAELFLNAVDSACVYHNASTRFTDGAEFGMGAEIGISTDKLHARGPMGLEELTTYKYEIVGNGVIRA